MALKAKSDFLPENAEFDHLYSEYLLLEAGVEPADTTLVREIHSRREETRLTWADVYTFELILSRYWPPESVRQKVLSLRSKYLKIAGQKAYDTYFASKLSDPEAKPPDPKDPTYDGYVELLRSDARYLLDQLYLLYAAVPAREGLSKWLTIWTAVPLLSLLAFFVVLFIIGESSGRRILLPISVVFLAGATGGFISMLQRLKAVSTEGDPVYNLSTFWHGAYSLFLSPLTGAVFAVLLYLLFTGNVLQGRFFPSINNPTACALPTPAPTASPSPKASPVPSPTPPANASPTASPATTPASVPTVSPEASIALARSASPQPTISPSPTASASPSPAAKAATTSPSESFNDFLKGSGPCDAKDYALLIIWCFIAGFAERFVPDTLTRLVSQASDGKSPEQSGGKSSS